MSLRIGNSPNNIFAGEDSALSRLRSVDGSGSEADLKGLSDKDAKGIGEEIKDELEYQISIGKADQEEGWDLEEIERTFGIFQS